jgi:hypothetical protein
MRDMTNEQLPATIDSGMGPSSRGPGRSSWRNYARRASIAPEGASRYAGVGDFAPNDA